MTSSKAPIALSSQENQNQMTGDEHPLVQTLKLIDPFLIFLTKKSGHISIPLATLAKALPPNVLTLQHLEDVRALVQVGVLRFHKRPQSTALEDAALSWSDSDTHLGFPPPADSAEETPYLMKLRQGLGSLHGSTKTGSQRRLKALLRVLKERKRQENTVEDESQAASVEPLETKNVSDDETKEDTSSHLTKTAAEIIPEKACGTLSGNLDTMTLAEDAKRAQQDLEYLFGFSSKDVHALPGDTSQKSSIPTCILDGQISYAGTHPAQQSVFEDLSTWAREQIPVALFKAYSLTGYSNHVPLASRRLYRHQTRAIEAALHGKHCVVCTGTGSGKSMCFLVPVLTAAYETDQVSLILYPTKALAQDQLTQLQALLAKNPDLATRIRPATLDGDTSHSVRTRVAESANIVLTNPDTLHAAILPNWREIYSKLLSRLAYVAIDEAHLYEGVFGAHVAMVLRRLYRIGMAAANHEGLPPCLPTFMATSATLPWPEQLFRRLCPIARDAPVVVLTAEQDGSPRSAKHFFLWNPPLLQTLDRVSTGKVVNDEKKTGKKMETKRKRDVLEFSDTWTNNPQSQWEAPEQPYLGNNQSAEPTIYRRHPAEETALLLARALVNGVRCIAFCKTRNLVEWVYERTIACLRVSKNTTHLVDKLESYRGGYSKKERREIEQKLFHGELLGVIGTNALELGVDIGGVDLVLHCGYPSSYSSLLQQAGRAGRDKNAIHVASCSVVVCFDSPLEQHLWRHPKSLLSHGLTPTCCIPMAAGLVQSHLLCACEEFPLTKEKPVSHILGEHDLDCLTDRDLFGGEVYDQALDELIGARGVVENEVNVPDGSKLVVYQAHYSQRKPWSRLSIRSIEPVNYLLVNLAHAGQRGRMDAVHDEGAIIDTIPYSRVFYYSHPGAIILHRGTRFKITSMTAPPPMFSEKSGSRASVFLAAFAKPTQARYFTRPLSKLNITVVKTLHKLEVVSSDSTSLKTSETGINLSTGRAGDFHSPDDAREPEDSIHSFAGCGTITVKRRIYGYTKLSLVTRTEISRSELNLPEFEYDTFGVWLDVDRDALAPILGARSFGAGVHALAHALLAVAPIFVPGVVRQDLECDHAFYEPRRIMLFDERAGGSGACQRLWSVLFQPQGIIEAAVELLEGCRTCSSDSSYDSGCPACLHASNCLNFNLHMSRTSGKVIGRHLLNRLREMDDLLQMDQPAQKNLLSKKVTTPRRTARERGLRKAKEMQAAQKRQFVVGRPAWPLA